MNHNALRSTEESRHAPVVLVVEDDADCLETICDTLRDASYVVRAAQDGEEALRLLLASEPPEPTVIVLDLWLPGMSGQDFLKRLKSHERLSRIPVIVTSAGRPNGADSSKEAIWLAKPFAAERLVAAVKERVEIVLPPAKSTSA
jgi:DNA-binding response OmpR family regulator